MQVINVPNSGHMRCPCGSWKDHWVKFNPNKLAAMLQSDCSAVGCAGKFEQGGHVRKAGDMTVYIVPLCAACNSPENIGPYFIYDHIARVPADPKATCDPR
ncbi:MAG TPA: hypothetical protein VJ463_06440 [Geothrix sp.]|nr:hypothetical protein [Geothrix sp.]